MSFTVSSSNSASISTRRPLSAHSSSWRWSMASTGANLATNSGAPIINVRTAPSTLARTPAILRAEEKAITSMISACLGGVISARIACPVILPPLVSWAMRAASSATPEAALDSFISENLRAGLSAVARVPDFSESAIAELISTPVSSNATTRSSVTSSLVSVPVLSTASKFSSAIASIAANFCGSTLACASRSEPNASSRELASSSPSGTTVTAAEVIVFKIITTSSPEK